MLTERILEHVRNIEREQRKANGLDIESLFAELGISEKKEVFQGKYVLDNYTKILIEKQKSYGKGNELTTANIDTEANLEKLLPLTDEELEKYALLIDQLIKYRRSEGLDLIDEDVFKR